MAVAYRQPTFKNPLPAILKAAGTALVAVLAVLMAVGDSVGRSRAAHHLAMMGYHEEAKRLMLKEDGK